MVIEEWHNFVKTKNINILDRILSEEVVFYSPAVHTPQGGKHITKKSLLTAAEVLYQKLKGMKLPSVNLNVI